MPTKATAKTTTKTKTKKPKRTRVAIVQDKSGSMQRRRETTIEGYNEYVQTLRVKGEGQITLTLTQFDTSVNEVFSAKPLADVKSFTRRDYVPGGMTALHDAIGRTVREIEKDVRKSDKVVMVVMTDGLENSSREWSKDAILKLLEEKREEGWEFIFLGAGEESWQAGYNLGFTKDAVINYSGIDAHDHKAAVKDAAFATSGVTSGQSVKTYLRMSSTKANLEAKAQKEVKPRSRARTTKVT